MTVKKRLNMGGAKNFSEKCRGEIEEDIKRKGSNLLEYFASFVAS